MADQMKGFSAAKIILDECGVVIPSNIREAIERQMIYRPGHVEETHGKYPLTGIEYPIEPLTGDANKTTTPMVDPDRAEAMRRLRDLEEAALKAAHRKLTDPKYYDPNLDPMRTTLPNPRCCWCGMQDRHEFFQGTAYGEVDPTAANYECKEPTECAARVALSAGRHQ